MTEDDHNLIKRENQMQQYAIAILDTAQKLELSVDDIAIVFGGIIRGQAKANAEYRGIPENTVAEELLRKFIESLQGVHETSNQARH
jgi:catalase (peroxidase I)